MGNILTGDQYTVLDGKLHEIKRQLRQKEGYPFDIERLGRALQAVIEGRFEAVGSTAMSAFQTLLTACRPDRIDPDFNEVNFPLEPVAPDEADWEVYEHHFDKKVTGEEAFHCLQEMDYRLCGPRRAMEFTAKHPHLQLDRPFMVTARWQGRDGGWYAPLFARCDHEPYPGLRCLADIFPPYFGWLVLRRRG